jgi:hypothetical protein
MFKAPCDRSKTGFRVPNSTSVQSAGSGPASGIAGIGRGVGDGITGGLVAVDAGVGDGLVRVGCKAGVFVACIGVVVACTGVLIACTGVAVGWDVAVDTGTGVVAGAAV